MNIPEVNSQTAAMSGTGTSKQTRSTNEAFTEAMNQFEETAKQKIKDGDTKFQIGGSAMSLDEWDKLMGKIDKNIDAIKESVKEQIEQQQEEAKEEAANQKNVTDEMVAALVTDKEVE